MDYTYYRGIKISKSILQANWDEIDERLDELLGNNKTYQPERLNPEGHITLIWHVIV